LDEGNLLCRWRTLNEFDRHIRVPFRIDLQELPQKARPHGWLNTDAQMASPASTCVSRHSGRALKVVKGFAGFLDESGACIRELEATRAPLEQRYTKRLFKLPQATTHGRVSNTKLSCGTPETPLFSNNERPADRYRLTAADSAIPFGDDFFRCMARLINLFSVEPIVSKIGNMRPETGCRFQNRGGSMSAVATVDAVNS
jgi:hypothetical protein